MAIYNNGNPVKWGKNGREWYVTGEYGDYFILLLKEADGEVTYDCSAYSNSKAYPVEWADQDITLTLKSWGEKEFSAADKASMLSTSVTRTQGIVTGYTFELYATLLTAAQVDQYLPKKSSERGSGWWIKKDILLQEFNLDIIVKPDGFRGASTDGDHGFRPAIGVKKEALRSQYPNVYSIASYSIGSAKTRTSSNPSPSYSYASSYTSSKWERISDRHEDLGWLIPVIAFVLGLLFFLWIFFFTPERDFGKFFVCAIGGCIVFGITFGIGFLIHWIIGWIADKNS